MVRCAVRAVGGSGDIVGVGCASKAIRIGGMEDEGVALSDT